MALKSNQVTVNLLLDLPFLYLFLFLAKQELRKENMFFFSCFVFVLISDIFCFFLIFLFIRW
ncbi:hypothetical protein J3R30DRAFT_3437737 [Lentinula aciculospora]|uniref:Uncharacterized protein n=1 Tax=Lentinula aciculospora TaxID=153920 RepID=A0A9W9AMZ7_9AGAR|nr:hypothetical protein J3R30DRAFT_3437737 [Lentinula aciculospora]